MRLSISTAALLLSFMSLSAQSSHQISAEGGDIVFTPIIHASVQVEHAGTVIHVDPWSAGDLSQAKPADLILVTDDPGHHLLQPGCVRAQRDDPGTALREDVAL